VLVTNSQNFLTYLSKLFARKTVAKIIHEVGWDPGCICLKKNFQIEFGHSSSSALGVGIKKHLAF